MSWSTPEWGGHHITHVLAPKCHSRVARNALLPLSNFATWPQAVYSTSYHRQYQSQACPSSCTRSIGVLTLSRCPLPSNGRKMPWSFVTWRLRFVESMLASPKFRRLEIHPVPSSSSTSVTVPKMNRPTWSQTVKVTRSSTHKVHCVRSINQQWDQVFSANQGFPHPLKMLEVVWPHIHKNAIEHPVPELTALTFRSRSRLGRKTRRPALTAGARLKCSPYQRMPSNRALPFFDGLKTRPTATGVGPQER